MIIRLTEKINSVCGKYTAAKGDEMDVIKYDDRIEVYHCKRAFATNSAIVYEVCKECAEVVHEQNPASDSVLDQFQYNDDGKLEPINKELPVEEKQTLNSISVGAAAQIIAGGFGIEQDYKGESIHETLAAREANYGRFADQAELSQQFKNIAHSAAKWDELPADMKESIDMICHKIARVLNGRGAEYADNWHDIAGYATLVEDRLNEL